MYPLLEFKTKRAPWNKGKLTGQKPPLKAQQIWAIRIRLQINDNLRDLALFNMAIDSKLRGCDLVNLRVSDIAHGGRASADADIAHQPVSARLLPGHRQIPYSARCRIKGERTHAHYSGSIGAICCQQPLQ